VRTVIYLDVLLLVNFVVGAAFLLAAGLLCGACCSPLRLVGGAGAAAVSSLALLAPTAPWPLALTYKGMSAALCVAAAYNGGQGRISSELKKQLVDQAVDLWLVEETSRYMFRLLAAKAVISNPQRYGFLLKREHLYPVIPHTEINVTTSIDNLAQFAKSKGITYAQLKDANPWLRDSSLQNKSGRTYVLKIPTQAGMHYDPKKTVPHNRAWVIN